MQITVIGCGYLGVTQAACWAARGHQVLGVDLDEDRILALQNADLPFYEPGLEALLRTGVSQGRLSFTTSYMQAVNFANVHFLTVGTPEKSDGTGTDISAVIASVEKTRRTRRATNYWALHSPSRNRRAITTGASRG